MDPKILNLIFLGSNFSKNIPGFDNLLKELVVIFSQDLNMRNSNLFGM
jgi:hypothetical protein